MHPRDVLFAGEAPPRRLPVVDHYCGVEKLMRKSLALQASRGPVFDVTLDCEDGAAVGAEAEHVRMVRELLEGADNRHGRVGVRVHPTDHPAFAPELAVLAGAARPPAYLMLPKLESAAQLGRALQSVREAWQGRPMPPLHALIETHGGLREVEAVRHPRVVGGDLRLSLLRCQFEAHEQAGHFVGDGQHEEHGVEAVGDARVVQAACREVHGHLQRAAGVVPRLDLSARRLEHPVGHPVDPDHQPAGRQAAEVVVALEQDRARRAMDGLLDDLGLRPLTGDEPIDLYEIIRQRYQHGATILTSNRAVDELPALFGDPLLASAAMDRLLHGAHVVILDGDSYRNPPPERTRKPRVAQRGAS